MYISQLCLNPKAPEVFKDLSDCYALHRRVMSAFPQNQKTDIGARQAFSVLYRIEYNRVSRSLNLYVQSNQEPKWNLPAGYLLDTAFQKPPVRVKEYHLDPKIFHQGKILKFSLRANPTKKKDVEQKRNGRREPLRTKEEIYKWIQDKGDRHGFEVINCIAYTKADVIGKRTKGIKIVKQGEQTEIHEITLQGVNFEGTLKITDSNKFIDAMQNGIGQGKAFGLGMLLLRPA